jgi:phospholipase D1/2
MPWRDIAVRLQGPIVSGMKRHFLQFWNFNNIQFSYKNSNLKIQDKTGIEDHVIQEIIDEENKKFVKPEVFRNIFNGDKNNEKNVPETKKDLKSQLLPDDKDVVIKTQQISNDHKLRIRRNIENEVLANYFDFEDDEDNENDPNIKKFGLHPSNQKESEVASGSFTCQGLRSGSLWSIGLPLTSHEQSIQNAYIKLIENSEYFVYIENQFFISSCSGEPVTNKVVETLTNRIIRAIEEKKPYIAYIVLPLLPGFGGDIVERDGQLLRIQIEWHLATIFKSEKSLIKRIMAHDPDWSKYVKIFGLRNHALMNGAPVSEIVYVHSKLLIVDDKIALIGSANINDRSLRGDRDSELAIVVEEQIKEPFRLGGNLVLKSPNVRAFRINCWKSLFEVDADYEDPLDNKFQEKIEEQAKINENFYWKLFGFYPHDSLKTLKEISSNQREILLEYYEANKHIIKGFALMWPTRFLENEEQLRSKFLDIGTTLLPEIVFT